MAPKKIAQTVLTEGKFYTISAANGKVVEVADYNIDNGAKIQLMDNANFEWQQWNFVAAGDGVYRIQNRFTGKMMDLDMGGVSDGTKAKPTIALSYALPENMEYHGINFTVKGTEFKSGKYIVGTTELVQSVLDEFDGDMEKATNKYGIGFTATQLETLMSDAGLQLPFNDLEPETEYMLLVRGQNVHGLTFETLTATTAVRPQGSADYERYIGTWTVTTTLF